MTHASLRLRDRALELGGPPLLVGVVNANPDSFSDPQRPKPLAELVRRAHGLVADGATLIDVGGESGRTDRPAVSVAEEVTRLVPLVDRLAGDGLTVSVDTWRAPVARAVLRAGAAMINDVSALSDPELAEACAESGAALVITHTRLPPKRKGFPPYDDVMRDVAALLGERCEEARRRGMSDDGLVLDPGVDLAKTPAESITVLRRLRELSALGRPLLVAVSRKDLIGALTGRPPAARLAGTLAALGVAADGGAALLRVHDVAAARDYLAVRAALRGEADAPTEMRLDAALAREPDAA